jgi:xanthine dehydrogenase accessory factor
MSSVPAAHLSGPLRDPVEDILAMKEEGVLAIIVGVEGPSYRPVGAVMAVDHTGRRTGTLSSGCVETDIALHALQALGEGRPQVVRYGRGSPFMDIQLPCGGGLEIALVPRPDRDVLRRLSDAHSARWAVTLTVDLSTGSMSLEDEGETGRDGDAFRVRFLPEIRFLVFGKGPEASSFAALVQAAGYPNVLLSPDEETLAAGRAVGCGTRHLTTPGFPEGLSVDDRTAIVLFFHDHDWEPPILAGAVRTPAFYIGAQGSRRARDARLMELEAMGLTEAERARLRGPVGLVPSARDARTLAVSVLAEVLATSAAPDGTGAAGRVRPPRRLRASP